MRATPPPSTTPTPWAPPLSLSLSPPPPPPPKATSVLCSCIITHDGLWYAKQRPSKHHTQLQALQGTSSCYSSVVIRIKPNHLQLPNKQRTTREATSPLLHATDKPFTDTSLTLELRKNFVWRQEKLVWRYCSGGGVAAECSHSLVCACRLHCSRDRQENPWSLVVSMFENSRQRTFFWIFMSSWTNCSYVVRMSVSACVCGCVRLCVWVSVCVCGGGGGRGGVDVFNTHCKLYSKLRRGESK